ncbi:interleukin-1 beta [Eucyclogobius newberryi]|uniref:interleukin-1 beta n=1 Tax=Eucyclogobius newberryi TaxID=166745 RepID=UPI003B5C8F39
MADFDLSQALDMSSVEQPPSDIEAENFASNLQLVITCDYKTMQHVANLVVAINKMKKPLIRFRQELSNQQLCDAVLESLIEETTIETLESNRTERKFFRANSVNLCTLCDIAQKDIIQHSEELKLHAITLKGGNTEQKVTFQMSRYNFPSDKGQPIILSSIVIKNLNRHLTCSMQGEKAVLNLEEGSVSDLQNICSEKNMDRFLFYKTIEGISKAKFESVNCKGWFISTSSGDENQPLEMCQMDHATRLTCFSINK